MTFLESIPHRPSRPSCVIGFSLFSADLLQASCSSRLLPLARLLIGLQTPLENKFYRSDNSATKKSFVILLEATSPEFCISQLFRVFKIRLVLQSMILEPVEASLHNNSLQSDVPTPLWDL